MTSESVAEGLAVKRNVTRWLGLALVAAVLIGGIASFVLVRDSVIRSDRSDCRVAVISRRATVADERDNEFIKAVVLNYFGRTAEARLSAEDVLRLVTAITDRPTYAREVGRECGQA